MWPQYHWAPVHLLLRTLLSRPELASYIRAFAINCKWPKNGASRSIVWRCGGEPEYTADDMMRATSLIESLKFRQVKKCLADLKLGRVDLFVGLLFSTFTNLRHFHLSIDYQEVCKVYFSEMLERSVTRNSLRALETVRYGGLGSLYEVPNDNFDEFHTQTSIDVRHIDLLFSIPSLKAISMSLLDKVFRPRFSLVDLSSLDLHHSTISPSGLGRILLATPCLKLFKYDAWINVAVDPPETRNRWEHLDCAELGRELAHVKCTLEELYLSLRFFFPSESTVAREMRFHFIERHGKFRGIGGKVGTLPDFTKLTSLTMPTALIADWTPIRESYSGVELLPPRLANLLPMNTLNHLLLSDHPRLYRVMQPAHDRSEG